MKQSSTFVANQLMVQSSPPSNQSSANCQIKSKYMGSWDRRSIRVSLQDNSLYFSAVNSNQIKKYNLSQVTVNQDQKQNLVKISVPSGRQYEIKYNNQVLQTLNYIKYFKTFKLLVGTVQQMQTPHPKKVNYFATVRSQSFNENYIPQHRSSLIIPSIIKKQRIIERKNSYIIQEDWKRDTKKGGLVFINEDKKSIISKMISYIVKKVISTGSFMGISFPTFAMKPETILKTYCKCLGAAPLILDKIGSDPLERIKAFNAVILTISLQFNDIQKPFNPTLGQTFQGQIGGYPVYAQQVSHHPPISSFLLDGKNYILHGTLQLTANLGLNSAVGIFYGDVVIQFDDGGVVRGRMPSGTLTGMVFGETKFGPEGAVYSFDPINHLVSSYEVKQKDIMVGNIGILKPKSYQKFQSIVESKNKQKYEKYKNLSDKQYQKILSKIEVVWTSSIKYDDKMYFDYLNQQNLPIKLTQDISYGGQKLLPSDSSYRLDLKLRGQKKMEQSQDQKQRIQDQERLLKKLREKAKGLAHKNSLN